MKRVRLFLVGLLAVCTFASAHSITFSHVDVRLAKSTTTIDVTLPIAALLHERPSPLPSGTTEAAVRSSTLPKNVRASLTALLTARLRLSSNGEAVAPTIKRMRLAGEDIEITATAPAIRGDLAVSANLFPEDALHKVFVDVYRGEELAGQYALDRSDASFTLAASRRPLVDVIAAFVREGVHHIFIGPDHILFVLALILLGGRLRTQVEIITAFTVAHSITLALATLQVVQLPSRLVESVIALSIVIVGLHDLRQLRTGGVAVRDPRAMFAFGFGLVHGFGFASVLSELDLPRQALAWSLAAFNVGVEVGQVTIVLLAAPLLLLLRRSATPRLARNLLMMGAAGVTITGGFWFVQRALGVG
ncbi:HupE/UreJ family protein [Deinococcus yavapaiensis]|uniref:HupE/UreJ protein n=1 Tax=Deinococcus yavapaiensis KR-236 TaxID=694435 RepID=A0A318SIF2_9DEIO|nr:HupE/UreJ family protein [Deinococcus yavapaiensis]PYE53837.1 HupE/UreJ protein [Deinococcus yavapaiensis KR-236]